MRHCYERVGVHHTKEYRYGNEEEGQEGENEVAYRDFDVAKRPDSQSGRLSFLLPL